MDQIKTDEPMLLNAECAALVARPYSTLLGLPMARCYGTAVAYVPDSEGKARPVCRYHLDVWTKQHAQRRR